MDLFVLNKDLEVESIIDSYKSLIWTDRHNTCGDFEIYTSIDDFILSSVKQDYYLMRPDSEHVMIIEKLHLTTDAENGNMITISGRSLESILDRRVVWGQKTLSGNLQNGIKELITENIISPSNTNRKIENFVFEESTDPAITELKLEAQYTGDNLYDVVSTVCSEQDIGFKVTLSSDKKFVFKLYAGTDRSYDQTAVPYVVFAPSFDNLITSNYMESKSSMKNVTLVGGEGEGSERRYTAVGNPSGLDRREMFTDARDISSDSDEDITALFDFTAYASRAFNVSTNGFVEDSNFNSARADISAYIGRTISLTIPKYNNSSGVVPSYGAAFLDSAGAVVSAQAWEKYSDSSKNKGGLTSYDLAIPTGAKFLVATMYSQAAIDSEVYYGELDDFECITIKLSNDEYIAQLRQRGKEKLSENAEVISFEGEAETTLMFRYGEDFFIGDVVQISDGYGHETKARVLELVTSDDEEGYSVYPTFSTITNDGLPSGYLKLTYIESTGTQWIDTGVVPKIGYRVEIVFQAMYVPEVESWVIGLFETNAKFRAGLGLTDDGMRLWDANGFSYDFPLTSLTSKTTANGICSGNATINLTLFGQNETGGIRHVSNSKYCLYSCKIYNEYGTLVRDFIPCKNDTDVIGLYDVVEQKFYKNSGTGAFGVG